ncbi:MAG TPA: AAA family ATPase [Candidatus Methylomirabilis sp.]|nr:AAA family ATPase [Candidatus Methylomirabilis sp.]
MHDRETHREIREKVTGKLLTLDRTLEPILPALLALLDVPVEDTQWQALDPPQRRQRTLDAVKHLLLRQSKAQPVLVVFEDLHWIDAETQALLDALVESLPTARLLLLVNYRPEYQHGWVSKTYYSQLRLDALPPESAGQLLDALLGDDPVLSPLKQLLVRRGNPFFIEESIRTLTETGALDGERGAYRLARPIQAIEVPATVQVILAARIDRLSADDKQLLQTASVIGKDVPFVLLCAVAEAGEEAVQRGLMHLQAAEFLYETRLFPEPEYSFKHALTHEVTYGTLLQDRRKALHARIVGAIERSYSDRLTEHVEQLAHHAVRGEVWEQAVTYLHQAGAKAMERSANPEAVAYFEEALVALRHLPETRERIGQAIDLRFDLRNSLYPLAQLDRLLEHLRDAEVLAVTLDDPSRLGWVSVYMSQHLWVTGHPTEARAFGQSAVASATRVGDFALTAAANYHLGLACHGSGDYRPAESCFRMVVQLLEGELCRERCGLEGFPALLSRGYLAWTLAELGQFSEGIVQGQEGIRIAQTVDQPFSLTMAYRGLGSLYCVQGDFDHAIPVLERGLALSRESNMTLLSPTVMGWLGYAYAMSGRRAEGLSSLHEAVAGIESMGIGAFHALRCVQLSEAYLLTDRVEDALALAGRALSIARECRQRGYEAYALRLLGEVAARQNPPEHADGHYRDALALALELGMRSLVAHCHLGLGKLHRRTGQREQAQEHLTTATAMYREMDMRFYLEQAEQEMKEMA